MMNVRRSRSVAVLALLLVTRCPAEQSYADQNLVAAELQRSRKEYRTAESWARRRDELREGFLKGAGLFPLFERPPLKIIRHSRREYDDYSVENVALETLPGFYCTGNLYRPIRHDGPGPAILCPHGHFRPLGRFRADQQIRCAHFARMGATVFSYSMVGWQDSRQTTHDDPRLLALQTWNSLRVVDFLTGLDGVDQARIGVTGASGGGTQAMYLALIDDRVSVTAPLVIVYPWIAPEGCRCEGGMPVMQAARTNAIELAAAAAPRPQLIISVGNDPTQNFPTFGFPFIQRMYAVAGHAERVENIHFADEAHDFGPSKRKAVYEFFARHLNMPPRSEQLDRITIERPRRMEVFNSSHPLPEHAIHGSEAVDRALTRLFAQRQSAASPPPAILEVANAPQAEYSFKKAGPADEALIFTPPGFHHVGVPAVAQAPTSGQLRITIRDQSTGQPTGCRVNVVGADGNYYQPAENHLKEYSLTGQWPKKGWGNRPGKAPIRYFGRFFYCDGHATVKVPAGAVRVEVWKGFEYRPETRSTTIETGQTRQLELTMTHTLPAPEYGYWSGDPHIHIPRQNADDERLIFDLLEAEDTHFGSILAYNDPAGPYAGFMQRMASPQLRGLGKRSVLSRGDYGIMSGQEYRSSSYGHLNLFMLDHLVLDGQAVNADHWPPYGQIERATHQAGGLAMYAHGGYAKEIYADVVQGNLDAVELLQFGVYRGIGLIDWYHLLNTGFRLPATGACDYPACRKLGDCKTFVYGKKKPSFDTWLRRAAQGQSFVSTGPVLLLEVDGKRPGATIAKQGPGPHKVSVRVRVRCEVAPVTDLQLVANGRILRELKIPPEKSRQTWHELKLDVALRKSTWIAARAFSRSRLGTPDAESHTNPVYVDIDGRAPYDRESLDVILARIDGQIAFHKKRPFAEQARVIAYFERSRDILVKIRQAGGMPSGGDPATIAASVPALKDPGARTHSEEELKEFLKPVPPKPIDEALNSFETVDGFEMQLVAREPAVTDPIAAAFDERGNLYVCQMSDYPYKPRSGQRPIGSVRLLKDRDGDGRFDESHVFADHLLWAAGVAPWKEGVFVAAPPDIWYLKDTDGDDHADVRRKVFTGFGTQNQQAMVNNLKWGLDHKIYGSTAGNGGIIHSGDDEDGVGINLDGHDFRFDPATGKLEAITGTVQFGNTFDDWGHRFVCSQANPLRHVVLPHRPLARNPYLLVPSAIKDLAPAPVPIFRISPTERWRQIRSSRRIAHAQRSATSSGASHHVIDAAAGVTIYRGGAYPKAYYGNVFIGGAQNNLIHRRILSPHGVTFTSRRADANTEFVRSSDNWFRPVNFVNSPDGTLYVLDMNREVLEAIHIPLDVVKHLDLKSGRNYGRIYRLAPPGFKFPGPPSLGNASTQALVAALESPHGWWRDTAHRLLYERQDPAAIEPLRRLLAENAMPQARLHALWSLDGLNSLTNEDLARGLADRSPHLREHAVRLAESRLDEAPRLLNKVLSLADDANARVRFQVAFSLGEVRDRRAAGALARIARSSASDVWIRTALLSSVTRCAEAVFAELAADQPFVTSAAGADFLEQLARVVGARNQGHEVETMLSTLATATSMSGVPELQRRLVLALGSGLRQTDQRLQPETLSQPASRGLLQSMFDAAKKKATDSGAAEKERVRAIELLGNATFERSGETLVSLLDIQQPEQIQIAAVRSLSGYPDPRIAALLIDGWRRYAPAVRQQAIEALLSRGGRTEKFLVAIEQGKASIAEISPTYRALLLKHGNAAIRAIARKLFGTQASGSRAEIIARYKSALGQEGDLSRGEKVFRRECQACHRVGDVGHSIGPDLASSPSRDAQALLVHVLDPNRYVLPTFEQYILVDTSGRTYTGIIVSQTATSITLKREEEKTDTILRNHIDQLQSTGNSLMPEGFEKKILPREMADLLAFLQSAQASSPAAAPLDIGTLPGLIEPEK